TPRIPTGAVRDADAQTPGPQRSVDDYTDASVGMAARFGGVRALEDRLSQRMNEEASKSTKRAPKAIIQVETWMPAIDGFLLNHSMIFLPNSRFTWRR